MRKPNAQSSLLAAVACCAGGTALLVASPAFASNPLEYPDNGSASFSRGGAWLAVANEPIATHYNPAALATQGSGFSIEQQLNFSKVCYERRGPDGKPEIVSGRSDLQYLPACNSRSSFPSTIPSISLAWRVTSKLGVGIAVVPPATYGIADGAFPATSLGYNPTTNTYQQVPAPYRYQLLDQLSTILYPTLGVGYEIAKNFRVGAAFVSGIAVINTTAAGISQEPAGVKTDHAEDDGLSALKTKDLFVPGAILSVHWSVTPELDVAAWGRWMSPVQSSEGELTLTSQLYRATRDPATGAPGFSQTQPVCRQPGADGLLDRTKCGANVAVPNVYGNETFRGFKFPIPPEVRVGVRYHQPRSGTAAKAGQLSVGDDEKKSRDPLHDDLFDVELDGSYTLNSRANTIEIRFAASNGAGASSVVPTGLVPPNADRWNGYIDSYGIRAGGQVNVIQDKLGIRAGTWVETRSQEPAWLQLGVVGGMRGGFGGGIVLRQNFIDISIGFQHHWSQLLDNGGNGAMRSTITSGGNNPAGPNIDREPGATAATRREYRSLHTVNDGRLSQSANAFTLGGTIRF